MRRSSRLAKHIKHNKEERLYRELTNGKYPLLILKKLSLDDNVLRAVNSSSLASEELGESSRTSQPTSYSNNKKVNREREASLSDIKKDLRVSDVVLESLIQFEVINERQDNNNRLKEIRIKNEAFQESNGRKYLEEDDSVDVKEEPIEEYSEQEEPLDVSQLLEVQKIELPKCESKFAEVSPEESSTLLIVSSYGCIEEENTENGKCHQMESYFDEEEDETQYQNDFEGFQCSVSSISQKNLNRLKKIHAGEKPCEQRMVTEGVPEVEANEDRSEHIYCSFKSKYRSCVDTHLRTHAVEKHCEPMMVTEEVSEENEDNSEDKYIKCIYCSFRSKYKSCVDTHLRTHTVEKHCEPMMVTEEVSEQNEDNSDVDDGHWRNHTGKKPFKCSFCPFTSKYSGNLKIHTRIHTNEKLFKCQYCSYSATSAGNLNRHKVTHTGERPFKCSHCSFRSTRNSVLKVHTRIHTGEKPFKCSKCSYRSSSKGNLLNHARTHTGERPFKCEYCPYRASEKRGLKLHNQMHTGERPYSCVYCPFRTTRKEILTMHTRIHTGEKPFKCVHCSFRSARKVNVRKHLKVHMKEKSLTCSSCSFRCVTKKVLRKHRKIHKKDKSDEINLNVIFSNEESIADQTNGVSRSRLLTTQKPFGPTREEGSSLCNQERESRKSKAKKLRRSECAITWTKDEKAVILDCFYYSRYGIRDRTRKAVFVEQLQKSMLPKEKLKATTIKKLYSLISQVPVYFTEEELEDIRKNGEERAKGEYTEEEAEAARKLQWTRSEKWVLVWSVAYAKERYEKLKEWSQEWKRVFFHHCPDKRDWSPSRLTKQKSNFLSVKVFEDDELKYMKDEVEKMVSGSICPIDNPIKLRDPDKPHVRKNASASSVLMNSIKLRNPNKTQVCKNVSASSVLMNSIKLKDPDKPQVRKNASSSSILTNSIKLRDPDKPQVHKNASSSSVLTNSMKLRDPHKHQVCKNASSSSVLTNSINLRDPDKHQIRKNANSPSVSASPVFVDHNKGSVERKRYKKSSREALKRQRKPIFRTIRITDIKNIDGNTKGVRRLSQPSSQNDKRW